MWVDANVAPRKFWRLGGPTVDTTPHFASSNFSDHLLVIIVEICCIEKVLTHWEGGGGGLVMGGNCLSGEVLSHYN